MSWVHSSRWGTDGTDRLATPGELAAAGAGEHPAAFDVDSGVDKGRGQVLGEVLQVMGQVLPGEVG